MTYLRQMLLDYIKAQQEPDGIAFFENGLVEIKSNSMCALMSYDFYEKFTNHPKFVEQYKELKHDLQHLR